MIAALPELLPAVEAVSDGPPSGAIFKIERGPSGEKAAYARLFSGTLNVRDRVHLNARNSSAPSVRTSRDGDVSASPVRADGDPSDATQNGRHASRDAARGSARDDERKITAVGLFQRGAVVQASSITAGQIGKLWGLGDVQIGDTFGTPPTATTHHHFAPPTLESVILPRRASDAGALHAALAQLAEQDPLINLRQDDTRHELAVSLYGEVQKEVIEATLAAEYGIEAAFRETTVICVERPAGTGAAVEYLGKGGNPFCATVGLRVEPSPIGSGLQFRLDAPLASLPLYVYKSISELRDTMTETVHETLREGLFGWQVTDDLVTMTHAGYVSPVSTAADFRKLTPLVLMAALERAGTVVYEPIHRLQLEIPPDTLGAVMSALVRARAVVASQEVRRASYLLIGEIPVAQVHQLKQLVPALTRLTLNTVNRSEHAVGIRASIVRPISS